MILPLAFHRDVEAEVDAAYDWYERQRPGLGEDFLAALDEAFEHLQATPQGHPKIHRSIRRASPQRFPYGIYYRLHADRIEVIAIQHSRQNPSRWKSRL
jgi:toxin ParE1/3/4